MYFKRLLSAVMMNIICFIVSGTITVKSIKVRISSADSNLDLNEPEVQKGILKQVSLSDINV